MQKILDGIKFLDEKKGIRVAMFVLAAPIILLWACLSQMVMLMIALGGDPGNIGTFLVSIVVVLALYALPMIIPVFLFFRGRYVLVLLYVILLWCGFFIFGGGYRDELLLSIGLPVSDGAPSGILVISKGSLPKDYKLLEGGKLFKDSNRYIQRYFSKPKSFLGSPGKIWNIDENYSVGQPCKTNDLSGLEKKTCRWGECFIYRETYDPKMSLKHRTGIYVNDNGSCLHINVDEFDLARLISMDQIMNIVNSMERKK